MPNRRLTKIIRRKAALWALVALGICAPAHASQTCLPEGSAFPASWSAPYPAFRVIGNLYSVGTAGLSVFLITSDDGHILVNTGLSDSTQQIRKNMTSLGFQLEDVRVLLTTQAHFDHTAAMAEIKALTGAEVWATQKDARVLADGGASDAHFGHCAEFLFEPIEVDRILADGQSFAWGDIEITTHLHPGHTEGSSSYTWRVNEAGSSYRVGIINMGSINDGKRLLIEPTYPGVATDFANTYFRQKNMPLDIWVSSHPEQYNLSQKYSPGQAYDHRTFVDPDGLRAAVEALEQTFLETMATELTDS